MYLSIALLVLLFNTAICWFMTQEGTEPLTGVNGRLFHFCLFANQNSQPATCEQRGIRSTHVLLGVVYNLVYGA